MVQIFIKTSNENEKIEELTIIELQGDLEVSPGENLSNRFMGELLFNNEGVPIMILGHHVLMGKVMSLDKPIVLLKKKLHTKNQEFESEKMITDKNDDEELEADVNVKRSTEYLIKAICRRKVLFNKRPRPIVHESKKA